MEINNINWKYLRSQSGKTQVQVCSEAGVSKHVLTRLENNNYPEVQMRHVVDLLKVYNAEVKIFSK